MSTFRSIVNEKSQPDKHLATQINEQLINHFGLDTISGQAIWRVSWAEDQYEKRFGTWIDYHGDIFLREVTEAREVLKYPHLKGRYVLEQLVQVPSFQQKDLCGAKISYEPMHPFWDKNSEYLPPNFTVAKFIIDTVYACMGKSSLRKYVDPDADGNNGLEAQKLRLKEIKEGLYGNDTRVTDSLSDGTGVFMDSTKAFKAN